jgi:serine/threonine protein kinase
MTTPCLDPDDVAALLQSRMEPAALSGLEQHVAACSECRKLLSALAHIEALPIFAIPDASGEPDDDVALASTLPSSEPHATLAPGACVGRYLVVSELGAGAMGTVYAAHDPELCRKIALKILKPAGSIDGERELVRERLRREAQAMAQLAHPNVVTVYDVGAVNDQIFIAMELVEGQTLASWLAASPRRWREVVAMFLPAGRGLAAAHAAGMVHRDFKPENVLVGNDGRVRVGDFGLARMLASGVEGSEEHLKRVRVNRSGSTTGSLVGTPYFMAPEQFQCRSTDARSDQFSFCLALYVALARQHPFAGNDVDRLAESVAEGQIRRPPDGSVLPRRLFRVLRRGLATDPANRFSSMEALLAELGQEHSTRRPRVAIAAIIAVAIALVISAIVDRIDVDSQLRAGLGAERSSAGAAASLPPALHIHAGSPTTRAQPEIPTDWFVEGSHAYSLGEFNKAAEAFKQGFLQETDEARRNKFLFNMAQSYRLANDCGHAVAFYHRFLSKADTSLSVKTRKTVQELIDEASEACVRQQISDDLPSGLGPQTPRHATSSHPVVPPTDIRSHQD